MIAMIREAAGLLFPLKIFCVYRAKTDSPLFVEVHHHRKQAAKYKSRATVTTTRSLLRLSVQNNAIVTSEAMMKTFDYKVTYLSRADRNSVLVNKMF